MILLYIYERGNDFLGKGLSERVPSISSWKKIIFQNDLNYNKIFVVSNIYKTTKWELDDVNNLINNLKQNGGDGDTHEHYLKNYKFDDPKIALETANKHINFFNSLNVIWIQNKNLLDDFNFIRSAKHIIFSPVHLDGGQLYLVMPIKFILMVLGNHKKRKK